MKKFTGLLAVGVSTLVLNGCGGGSSSYNDGLTTLFLVDENGDSYGGIPYQCYDQGVLTSDSTTLTNGEFSFYPGEECVFDFYGYNGTDPDDIYLDELIYIVDDLDNGKNNIPYECELFNVGNINYTYYDGIWDGSFDYDADDACVFYL